MKAQIIHLYEVYRTDGCGEGRYISNIGYFMDKNLADIEVRKSMQVRSARTIPALKIIGSNSTSYYPLDTMVFGSSHKLEPLACRRVEGVKVETNTLSQKEIQDARDEELRNKTIASLSPDQLRVLGLNRS